MSSRQPVDRECGDTEGPTSRQTLCGSIRKRGCVGTRIDMLICTRQNLCKVPLEKCHTIMEKYGYTGSACIPMALDHAIELGKIKRGDLVVTLRGLVTPIVVVPPYGHSVNGIGGVDWGVGGHTESERRLGDALGSLGATACPHSRA